MVQVPFEIDVTISFENTATAQIKISIIIKLCIFTAHQLSAFIPVISQQSTHITRLLSVSLALPTIERK